MELLTLEFTATPKKSKEKQPSIQSYFKKSSTYHCQSFFVELIHIYPSFSQQTANLAVLGHWSKRPIIAKAATAQ
jgi:hypothetical protein